MERRRRESARLRVAFWASLVEIVCCSRGSRWAATAMSCQLRCAVSRMAPAAGGRRFGRVALVCSCGAAARSPSCNRSATMTRSPRRVTSGELLSSARLFRIYHRVVPSRESTCRASPVRRRTRSCRGLPGATRASTSAARRHRAEDPCRRHGALADHAHAHFLPRGVYGPRVTGSPNLKAAGEWALKRESWGFTNGRSNRGTFRPPRLVTNI